MVKKIKARNNPGANLKRIRLELGLAQQAVGDLIGTGQSYISAIESGKQNFTPIFARNLIKEFKKKYKLVISPNEFGLTD